jgi:hypothetical protein
MGILLKEVSPKGLPETADKHQILCTIKLDKKRNFPQTLRKFNIKASQEILGQFCNQLREKHITFHGFLIVILQCLHWHHLKGFYLL